MVLGQQDIYTEKNKVRPLLHITSHTKINSKQMTNKNVSAKTAKLSEATRYKSAWPWLDNGFLNNTKDIKRNTVNWT